MKTLYFDCIAGASGDMILGALVDAGLAVDTLRERLGALHLADFDLKVYKVAKHAFTATKVDVIVADDAPERHLADILHIVEASDLAPSIKVQAVAIFNRMGEAEAGIHGTSLDHVHLHELGGVDTIVDVVGALVGLEALGIERVVVSPVPLGRGFIRGAHGQIPLPAPATVALLKGVPVVGSPLEMETVTPTGAALLSALATDYGPIPPMVLEAIGYGAGSRDLPIPNVLRVLIGEEESRGAKGRGGKGAGEQESHGIHSHPHDHVHPHPHSHVDDQPFHEHTHPHEHDHSHDPQVTHSVAPIQSSNDSLHNHSHPHDHSHTHEHPHTYEHDQPSLTPLPPGSHAPLPPGSPASLPSCFDITELSVLETNIDDLNPEIYEYVMDRLFQAGALDVFFAPIQMKKNRPATLLRVLCRPDDVETMTAILFSETSTLGIREQRVARHALRREIHTVETDYGPVHIKTAYLHDGHTKSAPEYADCRHLAEQHGVPLQSVYQAARHAAEHHGVRE
ncbi:MAG: LarC family nickel insertion protein [Anaerolineae bacterium]|nr:LarC family nickel insertion protein [Anaerolineae bacterium]